MRALRVHKHGDPSQVLQLDEVEPPAPGPDQVQIQVAAAALNFADDLLCRGNYQLKPDFPFTPGLEVAGTITACGENAAIASGTRVIAVAALPAGGLAEFALADAANVYAIPDSLPDDQAAGLLIPFQTSHLALHHRGRLQPGETLLVHAGAGGVGSAAIQLGVAAGARVIATAGGPEKLALCRELGAELAIDYRKEDFAPAVRAATGGNGADVIYDSVGGDTFDRSRKCIANEGRILIIGFAGGKIAQAPTNHVLIRNYSIVGVYVGAIRERALLDRVHDELMALYAAGKIRTLVQADLPLAETAGAIADLANRRTVGKVLIRPSR